MKLGELLDKLKLDPPIVTAMLGDVLELDNRGRDSDLTDAQTAAFVTAYWFLTQAKNIATTRVVSLLRRVYVTLAAWYSEAPDADRFVVVIKDSRFVCWSNEQQHFDVVELRRVTPPADWRPITTTSLDLVELVKLLKAAPVAAVAEGGPQKENGVRPKPQAG